MGDNSNKIDAKKNVAPCKQLGKKLIVNIEEKLKIAGDTIGDASNDVVMADMCDELGIIFATVEPAALGDLPGKLSAAIQQHVTVATECSDDCSPERLSALSKLVSTAMITFSLDARIPPLHEKIASLRNKASNVETMKQLLEAATLVRNAD